MPDDLHGERRRHVRLPGLTRAAVFLVAICAAACSRSSAATRSVEAAPSSTPAAPSALAAAGELPNAPATVLLRGYARDGAAATDRLMNACGDRAAYLAIRRSATASLGVWRAWLKIPGEAAFGPQIAIQETGGSIGALDRAIEAHDCGVQRDAATNLEGAFRVAQDVLGRSDVPPRIAGQALSDAAYWLGQAILESTSFVPEGDEAAAADVAGFVEFLESGTRAMGLSVDEALAPLARLRNVQHLADIRGRGALVRATGVLGRAIRLSLHDRGLETTLQNRPLRNAPEPSALTLPRPTAPTNAAKAELGRRLFEDVRLSPDRSRACLTCHLPSRAFSEGLPAPSSRDPSVALRRNTPSLLYAPLEAVLTWDGRVRTADAQALMVIHTTAEMGLPDADIVRLASSDPTYAAQFRSAFGRAPTTSDVGLALAAYEASALVPGKARIDRFARGELATLAPDESAGLDVFAGKGRCARCHVPPVFGGSRPPDFTAPVFAVLGVPDRPGGSVVDSDRGRDGAFRVPTVRNVGRTAPYFHHGRYPTLEEVVDFYDRGGGRGVGLDVPNQDPEVRPLHLTPEERRTLLVFMRDALDDTR
jgi:cytochrome c peroxidase